MMLVRRCEMLPVECIVRGHLAGSAWKEYRAAGTVHGERVPAGLREADALPAPMFTPSTKAATGDHDENIGFDDVVALLGGPTWPSRPGRCRWRCTGPRRGHAEARGIVIADTKFELGLLDGELVLADEVLTPDSSRFWPVGGYEPGSTPPGFDKQPVRDWLEATGWDKRPPPPAAARRGGGRHPGPLRRDLRAALGPILRRLARLAVLTPGGRGGRRCRATMAA